MLSFSSLAAEVELGNRPVSMAAVFDKWHVRSLRDAIASHEIEQFHAANLGILTVGSPAGPLTHDPDGSFVQPYTFGTIIKPLDGPPSISVRFLLDVRIAGVRCFGTDDPSGTDEPYIITTVFSTEPFAKDKAVQTIRFGPEEIGSVSPPQVFAQDHQLAAKDDIGFLVPGDGAVRINVTLMDHESGDPEDIKNKVSSAAQSAMAAAIAAIPLVGLPAAVLAKASGILDTVGDAIGGLFADLFGDDLIDRKDFVIDNAFLRRVLSDDPTLHLTSASIPGISYNYPRLKEDDSLEGRSWLFDRGPGKGTYRMFFKVTVASITPHGEL
jgi:hypothetical protein